MYEKDCKKHILLVSEWQCTLSLHAILNTRFNGFKWESMVVGLDLRETEFEKEDKSNSTDLRLSVQSY